MSAIELFDLDAVEIVFEVERAFDIKISDGEAARCQYVGDLFDVVLSKVHHVERGPIPCIAASAFRNLRKTIQEKNPEQEVTPKTRLSALMPAGRRWAWWLQLGKSSGLVLPSALPWRPSMVSYILSLAIGAIIGASALLAGAGARSFLLGAIATFVSLEVKSANRKHAETLGIGNDATVGDLAKITAAINIGRLGRPNASYRRSDIWVALVGVIRNFTGFSGPIEKRTRFKCI